jgi:hypothetical protein
MSARSRLAGALVTLAALSLSAPALAGASPSTRFPTSIGVPAPQASPVARAADGEDGFIAPDQPPSLCTTRFAHGNPFSRAGDVDMIVHDRLNRGAGSNTACVAPQNETTVAVNPIDPRNVVAGANDYRLCCSPGGRNDTTGWAYYSFDGGRTWGNVLLPRLTRQTGGTGFFRHIDGAGDPAVAFGPQGTVYYSNLVFSRTDDHDGVAVSVSHDGGRTWSGPHIVTADNTAAVFNDKPWIAVSPVTGDLVVTWTRYDANGAPIVLSRSSDGGASWSAARPIAPRYPVAQGSIPRFAADGTLFVAYDARAASTGYATDATVVARSGDEGRTFTNREVGRVYDDPDCYPVVEGSQTLSDEAFRIDSFPAFQVDPVTGRLAVVWTDDQGAGTCGTGASSFRGRTSNQVKLVTSRDGRHFTSPRRITTHVHDKVFPAVAARAGRIVVTYYTRGLSPATLACRRPGSHPRSMPVCLDYAARSSRDGFAGQRRLSSQSSNPYTQFAGLFIGDYTDTAIGSDGVAHATWTDDRGNPALARPRLRRPNQDAYVENFRP